MQHHADGRAKLAGGAVQDEEPKRTRRHDDHPRKAKSPDANATRRQRTLTTNPTHGHGCHTHGTADQATTQMRDHQRSVTEAHPNELLQKQRLAEAPPQTGRATDVTRTAAT
jgi:hypothetical protein